MPKKVPRPEPPAREITPEALYLRRREFIKNGALTLGTAAIVGAGLTKLVGAAPPQDVPETAPVAVDATVVAAPVSTTPTKPRRPCTTVTTYNNYYEFGTDKDDPARTAPARCKTRAVDGRGRRRGRAKPGSVHDRGHPQAAAARGAHLPACAASRPGRW